MAKKKVKKAPKVSKDININIRNIMSQIQNQPKRDYIKPQKRIPKDSFNNGQMYRAFAPAVTYSSNPLQPFYGVSAISNPPATQQLTSLPAVYKSEPIMVETNPYDMAPKPQPAPIEKPRPVVPVARIGDYAATAGPQRATSIGELAARTPADAFRPVDSSPLMLPASATAVSAPINQPSTKPLSVIEMLGANTPPYNPPMSASSIQSLTLPATAATAASTRQSLIDRGKVQISKQGKPMFPAKKMGQ